MMPTRTQWRSFYYPVYQVARRQSPNPKVTNGCYRPEISGEILVEFKESGPLTVFRQHIENGLDVCSSIADEMGVSAGYISQLATRAEKLGWLVKKGRKYVVVGGD